MDILLKSDGERGDVCGQEHLPIQEQFPGPLRDGTETAAAVIFAELLAERELEIAAPVFVP